MGYTGSHPRNRLTDLAVRQALPGRHADGHGLHLLVRPSGTRSWMQRLVVLDKRRDMGLGAYPLVSLADARKVAFQNRQQARSGGNPFPKRDAKAVPTLRQLAESAIEDRRGTWRGAATERAWITPFEKHVFPALGDVRIDQVTLDAVVAVLRPHWRGRGSAGYLLRQRLDLVFRRAIVKKYRLDNPASQARDLLPYVKRRGVHQPSLPYTKVRAAMAALQASAADPVIKDILLFIVLTAARLSEATGASWSEVNLEDRNWILPKERTKADSIHKVPLSDQVLEILDRVSAQGDSDSLLFTSRSPRGRIRPVTGESLIYWLRKLDLRDQQNRFVVTHGFRSTFRVWTAECAQASREAAEIALAHTETDQTVASYQTSDLLEVRRVLMQTWADYVLPRSSA